MAIQVSDDGPGIALAEQERIFERFYRAPGSRSGEGTGLGLAIARWIVEEHQGSIDARQRARRGRHLHRPAPRGHRAHSMQPRIAGGRKPRAPPRPAIVGAQGHCARAARA